MYFKRKEQQLQFLQGKCCYSSLENILQVKGIKEHDLHFKIELLSVSGLKH